MPYDEYLATIFSMSTVQINGIIVDMMTAIQAMLVIGFISAGYFMVVKIIAIGTPDTSMMPDGSNFDVVKSGTYDQMDLSADYGKGVSAAKLKREDDAEAADYKRRSDQFGPIPRGGKF